MANQLTSTIVLLAMVAVNAVAAFGPYPFDGLGAAPAAAAASNIESVRATGHAMAAENRATDAAIDRATGNPIGAAINENRALGHTVASNAAAQRSTGDALLAGGSMGSFGAAAGANVAANMATRAVAGGALGGSPLGPGGWGASPQYGFGAYPGAYGAGYGYPMGAYNPAGFPGPLGYGAGMNRISNAVSPGAAIANGVVGSALASTATAAGLGVSY